MHPRVFFALIRLRRKLPPACDYPVVAENTEFVLEGFWRSANTFAAMALDSVQPRRLRLAAHTHAAATVIRGVQLGKPVLVLIRNPADAVISRRLLHPQIPLKDSLRDYLRFYRTILPYRAGFVTALFQEVTTDFGSVIRRVNARFGTSFVPFEHTRAAAENIRHIADQALPAAFHLPADERADLNARLLAELGCEPLLREVERLYQEFVATCQGDLTTLRRIDPNCQPGPPPGERLFTQNPLTPSAHRAGG